MGTRRFLPSELLLSYDSFQSLVEQIKPYLSKADDYWLLTWERIDLARSPMDDNNRRWLRYGHYLGWFNYDDHWV